MKARATSWGTAVKESPMPVCATAAVNGAGLSSHQTWAFWRAELTPFAESPFRCSNGQRATMAHLQTLPVRCVGAERLLRLGRKAFSQLSPLLDRLPGESRVALAVGLSDRLAEQSDPLLTQHRRQVESELSAWLRAKFPHGIARFVPRGHASFAVALVEACSALSARSLDLAIVGGMETYYDPIAVRELVRQQRLFDLEDMDSMIPGEGAAFLLLARRDVMRHLSLPCLAQIEAAATDEEPGSMLSEVPCLAQGLSRAMRAITVRMKAERRQLEWVIGDVTNEEYRSHEWGLALPRSIAPGGLDTAGKDFFQVAVDRLRYDFIPECFGDLGAASMATAAVLAIESFGRGDPAERNCLITGSSVTRDRGAVLVTA